VIHGDDKKEQGTSFEVVFSRAIRTGEPVGVTPWALSVEPGGLGRGQLGAPPQAVKPLCLDCVTAALLGGDKCHHRPLSTTPSQSGAPL
jgi:hypothetical protein